MTYAKKTLAAGLLTAASLGVSSISHAVTYTEPGDAGQTLATASNTGLTAGGTGTLTGISGDIGVNAAATGGASDADLYQFTLGAAGTASSYLQISALGGTSSTQGPSAIDTSLFLFNAAGTPILANDDTSNTNYQATLNLVGLPSGTYYLGIALSGNEAINSASQQLFTVDQPTTTQRGAASGLNPATLSTFNGQEFIAETGTYTIGFAVVPEPSTWAAIVLGGAALGVVLRRRQLQQA